MPGDVRDDQSAASIPAARRRVRGADRELELTAHAASQMVRRGIGAGRLEHVLASASDVFTYYHDFEWKTGYYDRRTGTFIAVAGDKIVTVFANVSLDYVRQLRRLKP